MVLPAIEGQWDNFIASDEKELFVKSVTCTRKNSRIVIIKLM